jgi:integrase
MAESNSIAREWREKLTIARTHLNDALLSKCTHRGYRYDWQRFQDWCKRMEVPSLPAITDTLALYITDMIAGGSKVSTATRRVAAIVRMHRVDGLPSPVTPEIRTLLRGARRAKHERPRQVRPLSLADLRAISTDLAEKGTPIDIRNRALCVLGFASALRSVNIATLLLEDIEFAAEGLLLRIGREKSDQEGKGRLIGLPRGKRPETCPVLCLNAWLEHRGTLPGPVFTRFDTGRASLEKPIRAERICQIVQQCISNIGLNAKLYGSHSLRSGFVTAAGEAGVGELLIAAQTGHKDLSMVRRYFRRRDAFRSNAAALLDL